jgi:hypothetical protein
MTWRRALFRLWLIATTFWAIGWTLVIHHNCHALPNGELSCRAGEHGVLIRIGEYTTWSPLQIYLMGFAPAFAVLAVGALAVWVWSRVAGSR